MIENVLRKLLAENQKISELVERRSKEHAGFGPVKLYLHMERESLKALMTGKKKW